MQKLPIPGQDTREWQIYLEFIEAYFKNRGIKSPMVVEIGIWTGKQKRFYEEILGYRYIGIDNRSMTKPDILGDSKSLATVELLKNKLNGQLIDLLFIDDGHRYQEVKRDYELYSPLVKNMIVLHDIMPFHEGVSKFWNELVEKDRETRNKTFIIIQTWRLHKVIHQMGIGIILIKDQEFIPDEDFTK